MESSVPWRTATVVELCASMREAQDYSAAPILADALQDADYPHDEELGQLRDPHVARWLVEMLVAKVYSDETAAAVEWLRKFVRDINYDDNDGYDANDNPINERPSDTKPHTYEYVVEQGMVGTGRTPCSWGTYGEGGKTMCFGSDAGADYFRAGENNVREFFRNWSLATGLSGPTDFIEVSYRCAC